MECLEVWRCGEALNKTELFLLICVVGRQKGKVTQKTSDQGFLFFVLTPVLIIDIATMSRNTHQKVCFVLSP